MAEPTNHGHPRTSARADEAEAPEKKRNADTTNGVTPAANEVDIPRWFLQTTSVHCRGCFDRCGLGSFVDGCVRHGQACDCKRWTLRQFGVGLILIVVAVAGASKSKAATASLLLAGLFLAFLAAIIRCYLLCQSAFDGVVDRNVDKAQNRNVKFDRRNQIQKREDAEELDSAAARKAAMSLAGVAVASPDQPSSTLDEGDDDSYRIAAQFINKGAVEAEETHAPTIFEDDTGNSEETEEARQHLEFMFEPPRIHETRASLRTPPPEADGGGADAGGTTEGAAGSELSTRVWV